MITLLKESTSPKYKINQEVFYKTQRMILKVKDFYNEDGVWYYLLKVPVGYNAKKYGTYEVWVDESLLEDI